MPVYLKSIELTGFKSFPNKTRVEFSSGVTGIVGPNGCGKSNVVEAIKWVLGEQSPKSLRGEKMEDVIFNGSSGRGALGMADVNLTFNNEMHWLSADFNEVSISRRIFRSGEGQYYINRSRVRLKDVVELFLDTGVGKDSYAIFEQGKIDRLLSESPTERRSLFEEFAGISKFKFRKDDAERKLANSRINLERVEDVITELERELLSLKTQAEDAQKYNEIRTQLKALEIKFEAIRVANLSTEIEKRVSAKEELSQKMAPLAEELRIKEDGVLAVEADITQRESAYSAQSAVLHENERKMAEVSSRLKGDAERKSSLFEQLKSMQERLSVQGERETTLTAEKAQKETVLQKASTERDSFSEKLASAEAALNEIKKEMDALNQNSLLRSKALGLNRIVSKDDIENEQKNLYSTQANLEKNRATLEERFNSLRGLKEDQQRKQAEFNEAKKREEELKNNLEKYVREIDKIIEAENRLKEDSQNKNTEIRNLQGELKTMDKVIMDSIEKQSGELKKFTEKQPLFEARLESAFEALYSCVAESKSADETKKAVERLRTLFKEYRGYYDSILGILYSDEGTYTRKEKISERIEELTEAISQNNRKLESSREKLLELQSIRSEIQTKYSRMSYDLSEIRHEIERYEKMISALDEQAKSLENLIQSAGNRMKDSQDKIDLMNQIVSDYDRAVESLREKKMTETEKSNAVRIDFTRAEEQVKAVKNEVRWIEHQLADIAQMKESFTRDRENHNRLIEELTARIEKDTLAQSELSSRIGEGQKENEAMLTTLAELRQNRKVVEKQVADLQYRIQKMELDIDEKTRIAQEKAELLESIKRNALENFSVDLNAYKVDGETDPQEVSREITNLRRNLTRLGEVNMLAIEQYQSAEERKNFLNTQKEDILHAMAGIESLIAETNEKSIQQFLQAFEDIRSAYKRMFKRLFDGGRADMELIEPDKPLESGIDIMAEPPGTKFKSVSLLSGGQRAMVAIAIVFAILYLKPTPFVVLDELDAPLDDDNIERFKKLLAEFRGESQFVVVSHSKSTLEVCDVLYGVTMEEQGCSKVVNVAFDEAGMLFTDDGNGAEDKKE